MTTMNTYKLLRSSWLASLLGLAALGLVAGPAHAATLTWGTSGTGGAGTWTATDGWWNGTTQQTWSNATPDDAIFGGTGGAVTLAGGTTTAGGITFNAFTGSYTIGTASQALTINGGGVTMNSGAGAVTFQNSPITLGAAQSWTNNSSSLLTVSSGISNGGNLLTVAGSGNATLSGAIAGAGGLTKSGAGTLTLSAANTYSGTTTVNGGLITTPSNSSGSVRVSSFGTGPIAIAQSATVRLTGYNGGSTGSPFTAYYTSGYTNTVSGSGTLELVGQSSNFAVIYSGDLSGFTGTVSATAAAGTWVGFGNSSNMSLNATGSSARFVVSGAGNFVGVLGAAGTIAMGELSGDGRIFSTLNAATTWEIGALSTSSTFSGEIRNDTRLVSERLSSLRKVGSGTLTLTGSSAYTGGTQLNGGVLALGNAGALGPSGTISFGGGTLQFSASNTTDYSSRFSTAAGQAYSLDTNGQNVTVGTALSSSGGSLTKSGLGILTLSAANAYAGDTIIKGGTLKLASAGSLANSARIIVGDAASSGAVLDLTDKTSFSIGASQTLMGKGTALLGANTSLTVAGLFSPGNSPGLFTYDGGSTTLSGTTLMEIWGTSRGTNPGYDAVNVINSGLLTLGGMLELNFDRNFADTDSFLLFDTLTSGSLAGGFTGITITGSNNTYVGLSFTQDGNVWTTGYNINNQGLRVTQTASNVTLDVIVVPEPGTLALAGCGVALAGWMAARRRRRR